MENLRLNHLQNVNIVHAATSDAVGAGVMHLTPTTNFGSSSLYRTAKYVVPKQEVKVTTLTVMLEQYCIDHIDFMKIDIEGFEYEAVFGSPQVFTSKRIKALALVASVRPG
jgi:FkbM family methyltransferase